MFGIKINWDVVKERIEADLKRERTLLERVATIAVWIISFALGWQIGVWILESLGYK